MQTHRAHHRIGSTGRPASAATIRDVSLCVSSTVRTPSEKKNGKKYEIKASKTATNPTHNKRSTGCKMVCGCGAIHTHTDTTEIYTKPSLVIFEMCVVNADHFDTLLLLFYGFFIQLDGRSAI